MNKGIPSRAQLLASALVLLLGSACSTPLASLREPREKWFAHCDTCKWCKGSFKTSEQAQQVVSNHNKAKHDWFKVAYYDQVKCP